MNPLLISAEQAGNYLSHRFVHAIFEDTVSKSPGETAIIFGEHSITYEALNEKADHIAAILLHFFFDEDVIGISSTRSIEMIAGILAILKSGKAYLPLDPTYPHQRLQQIVDDAGIKCCFSTDDDTSVFTKSGLNIINGKEKIAGEKLLSPNKKDLAYILYTSGSTGKPKGVCMGHGALINLLSWQKNNSSAGLHTKTLQFAPLSFDVSFQEIFATLTTGGSLVLVNDEMRLDPLQMLSLIQEKEISRVFLPFIALQYLAEIAVSFKLFPACLTEIITAGEQLKITPQVREFFRALPGCTLSNQYGPTECHVVTALLLTGDASNWPLLPAIGKPIDQVDIFIVDDNLKQLPVGESGELLITGQCLADGYLHVQSTNEEKFISWDHPEKGIVNAYRTGDIGKYLPNGDIELFGRIDGQVKIRGNRIELGEIEVALSRHPNILHSVVIARETIPGQKTLVAYYIANDPKISVAEIRELLVKSLPDYMVPSKFILMEAFPLTKSGKVDRSQLPVPDFKRPELVTLFKKPTTTIEKNMAGIWAEILELDKTGIEDNFFELGGNSLLAQKTVATLKNRFNYILPITKLYQFATIAGIAKFLEKENALPEVTAPKFSGAKNPATNADVAIIGMAGRFPGANTMEEFWDVLKEGKETIRFFTTDELDPSIPTEIKNDPVYVGARGVIDNADKFDAAFFDLNPKLAELMDPQQRVMLEISREVLEKTGYLPQHYEGNIGVYAGAGNNTYFYNNVQGHRKLIEQQGSFQVMTANEKDYISSRIAYQLNLKGPAVSVYSACSTSLLAIAQAVESIRNGQCDIAIAGAASITTPLHSGHLYQEGGMLSRDGHCRSFDASASGTVFSDGAGVVLLKNKEAAIKDGDFIYAVIKGIGINNDGGGKASFTAPSSEGQANAIAMAIRDAGIDAATISYIESHGTATPIGDPIEIEGLKMAFGRQDLNQFCAIGSVKSNMGHLTAAAGVTGLIKTVLALNHGQLPPSLGYDQPNPSIDFANSPFYVNTQLTEWKRGNQRRAGISSFGVGGTNVHVVLEEFENDLPASSAGRPIQLINWSAKSEQSLDGYASQLAGYLKENDSVNLADAAFTLQTTRANFNHRRFELAYNNDQLSSALLSNTTISQVNHLQEIPSELIFMFPGQGSQYLNMGAELYANESTYKNAIDECAALLVPHLGLDIRQIIFPGQLDANAEEQLKNTRYTQPAIFITEYALVKLWMSWGIVPTIFCGHSIGEFVAAHFAGIFSLPDALHLIATRGKLVSELPRGSMLSVRIPAKELVSILPNNLSVAAINSNQLCVVAGEADAIAAFSKLLDEKALPNKLLQTSHAFHSAMMDPIVEAFKQTVSQVKLNRPQKPIVSTVSGNWLTDAEATDPLYWAKHLRSTVLFADATETILKEGNVLFLEVGPGNALTTLVRQQSGQGKARLVTSMEKNGQKKTEYESILTALGQLWINGLEPDWQSFYTGQNRIKIILPTYTFNRKTCWVDPVNNGFNHQLFQSPEQLPAPTMSKQMAMRKNILTDKIKEILEDATGIEVSNETTGMTFLEIGLDSLLLTQVALTLKKEFGLPISFRQLQEDLATPILLAQYLDNRLPKEQFQMAEVHDLPHYSAGELIVNGNNSNNHHIPASGLDLISQQLQTLAKQVALLQESNQNGHQSRDTNFSGENSIVEILPHVKGNDFTPEEAVEMKQPFGATARIERKLVELSDRQKSFFQKLCETYTQKTKGSKEYAQQHRSYMSDPRVVSGFKPLTKEIVYPIVVNKSRGSRLWDIDGNEYIDALNGFGSSMFGYQPEFIKSALHQQVENGFEVGPQHDLAGDVCRMVCDLTGFDRTALCSTGSEAVLGTMRIARTVTGRSLIVAFKGSYHGINDEVIVRGTKKLKSYPAAPGIMPEAVQNMLILDYGTDESLKIIKERAHELAAVLVEPVQSRRPEFRPVEFLKQLREITALAGTALIFDEVITGFRLHPGGAQAIFGIEADIASYGKVVGGGLPIGLIAGKKEWMDALDGGFWQYGDDSFPTVGVTYFAGTFVRHPLALASAKASLQYMKDCGPDLQAGLNAKGDHIANTLNPEFEKRKLPFFIAQFGSLWKIKFKEDVPYGELLFTLMRQKGIHIWDGFPCFVTGAHTDEEIDLIIQLFIESVDEMMRAGFFKITGKEDAQSNAFFETPPQPGAKLGRDEDGNPAWFIADKNRPGKYLQIIING